MSQKSPREDPAPPSLRAQGPLPLQASPTEQSGYRAVKPDMGQERFGAAEDLYGETAVDHFTHPRNVGGLEDPDGTGSDTNPSCGDRTTITVRIRDGRIGEARFRTFGCVAAIASASVLTELASGKTTDEARALGPGDLISALGGLPSRKEGCALMAVGALRAALIDADVRTRA